MGIQELDDVLLRSLKTTAKMGRAYQVAEFACTTLVAANRNNVKRTGNVKWGCGVQGVIVYRESLVYEILYYLHESVLSGNVQWRKSIKRKSRSVLALNFEPDTCS